MFRMMDNLQYCSFDFRLSRQMSLQNTNKNDKYSLHQGPNNNLSPERGGEGSKDSEKNHVVFRETWGGQ